MLCGRFNIINIIIIIIIDYLGLDRARHGMDGLYGSLFGLGFWLVGLHHIDS